jgi:hyaluronan synthase
MSTHLSSGNRPSFIEPLASGDSRTKSRSAFDVACKLVISVALVALAVVSIQQHISPIGLDVPRAGSSPLAWFFGIFGALSTVYFALTLFFALRYRPVTAQDDASLPTVTVIVPAYNEGSMVRVALRSALHSNYPRHKLHVIAVDDGSTDDTWHHIQTVAAAFPGRVTPVRQPKNGGKREALRAGFLKAEGDIVVTVDSDSKLEPDAIRSLVAPFEDAEVGAVAGKVMVLNRYENFLTRILAARFFVTFDLVRAAQSRFGAVLCTPGALSAYRRSAVMEVLEPWSTQTFLGEACTIGEDRALTTWLLRRGLRSVYQSSAVVHTLMPTSFRPMAKMMVRWERGNVRESLVMLPVLTTKWRTRDRLFPTLEILLDLIQYPVAYVALAIGLRHLFASPFDFVRLAGAIAFAALVQSLYSLRSERGTDFLYGVAYAFVAFFSLQWIFPYSCLTVRNGRWLTR